MKHVPFGTRKNSHKCPPSGDLLGPWPGGEGPARVENVTYGDHDSVESFSSKSESPSGCASVENLKPLKLQLDSVNLRPRA